MIVQTIHKRGTKTLVLSFLSQLNESLLNAGISDALLSLKPVIEKSIKLQQHQASCTKNYGNTKCKRNCDWEVSASVKFTNKCIKSPKTQLSTELCAKQIESANLPDFPAVFVFEICCKKMQIQNHEIDCKVRRTINYYDPYFLFVL